LVFLPIHIDKLLAKADAGVPEATTSEKSLRIAIGLEAGCGNFHCIEMLSELREYAIE
jgi:hypothetical protein